MAYDKKLYFIPIIARALDGEDHEQTMRQAFDEIQHLGQQPGYEDGFRQFLEFARAAVIPQGDASGEKIELTQNAIYRLICDLATDSFEGNKEQKELLTNAIKNTPEWNAEYERLVEEAKGVLGPDMPTGVEVLRDARIIGSSSDMARPMSVSPISPGRYMVRLSNGRVLWEGDLRKEDLIWAFAHPGKDLAVAAETEIEEHAPTSSVPLLEGELIMHVFAGLEAGHIRIEREEPI